MERIDFFDEEGMLIEDYQPLKPKFKIEQSILDLKEVVINNGSFIKVVRRGKSVVDYNIGTVIAPQYILINENNEFNVAFAFKIQNKHREFLISLSDLQSQDFFTIAASAGYMLSYSNGELKGYLKDLIMGLTNYLLENSVHQNTRKTLGWDEDILYIGNKVLSENGGVNEFIIKENKDIIKNFHTKGTKKVFDECLNIFSKPGFEKHKMYYLIGVSTPLLQLNNLSGVVNNFHSNMPGTCKSLTQYMIAMTYGDSKEVLSDFTHTHIFSRLGTLKNFPVLLDEVSDKLTDPKYVKEMNQIIYQLTTGKGKARSNNTGKAQDFDEFCSSVMCSANSMLENILPKDTTAVAKYSRLFEITLGNKQYPNEDIRDFKNSFLTMKNNYGFGIEWLKIFVNNKKIIQKEIMDMHDQFMDVFVEAGFRFLANSFACATIMAKLLRQMGYEQFNEVETFEFFKNEISAIKNKCKEVKVDPYSILESFLNWNGINTKYIKKVEGKNEYKTLNQFDNDSFTARLNKNNGELAISYSIFEKFLKNEYNVNKYEVLKVYFDEIGTEIKKVKINDIGGNLRCFVFKLGNDFLLSSNNESPLYVIEEVTEDEIKEIFKENYK